MILLDPQARPLIAHRGASGDYPENTLLAFEQGLAQGADALEFDVRVSADGVPVVIHDASVDRTTGGTGPVSDYAVRELGRLDAGSGEPVPTLEEVLGRFPDAPLIIEIKEAMAGRPTAEVLRDRRATKRVLVGSFEHAALLPFAGSEFVRSASRRETAGFWLASRVRWAAAGRGYGGFTVPVRYKGLTVVDRTFVALAARCAKPVHVWTVNERSEAERLRVLGVAGIITNFPARMRGLNGS